MTAREPAVLGLDLGTTEVKAGLVALDGRLLALTRSGYALDVARRPRLGGAGPRRLVVRGRQRGPGAARRRPRGDRRRSAWTATARPSSPSTPVARRRARRSRSSIRAATAESRRARRRDRRPRLVARWPAGRALGRAPRTRRCRGDLLVPLDLGVARAPPVPASRRRRWSPTRSSPTRPARRGRASRSTGSPPRSAMGDVVGGLTETAADALGLPAGDPGRRRYGRRVRELHRRRAARAGRRLRSGRFRGRVRGLLGPPAGGARRLRDAGAAGRALQRRRGDGRHRPGARLVSRCDPRRHDHDRRAAGRGGRHAARRRRPRLPAVPRRRAFADLGSRCARRARRADPRARARPRRAGHRRGVGAGHPSRRRADARGRRRGDRHARLRRTGPQRVLERGQGGRHRLPGRSSRTVLETAVLGSAILAAVGIGAAARPPDRDRAR